MMLMNSVRVESAVERLNRECQCMGADIPALHRWLEQDLGQRGLTTAVISTHPHLFSHLPVFVGAAQVAGLRGIVRAAEEVIALPAYRDRVLANAPAIARPQPAALGVLMSYDFHLAGGTPQLIEINTNAGGALLNVSMRRAQLACCGVAAHYLATQPTPEALEEQVFAMFAEEWRHARGARPLGCVAIIDDNPGAQYLYPEFLLFAKLFESRGMRAIIAAPEQLTFDGDAALRCDGQLVDLVYNRLTDFYFETAAAAPLAAAYRANAAVITPHAHAHALYANKHNFELLTDEPALRAMGVTPQTIDTLLRGIPRTVALRSATAEQWWAARKEWFFKPARGFGSRGAYRGDKLTKRVFEELLRGDYVAQRLTPPSARWNASGDAPRALKLDLRCYVYDGKPVLLAARLYQGQTTNFRTEGGGFAPVYVIDNHPGAADDC